MGIFIVLMHVKTYFNRRYQHLEPPPPPLPGSPPRRHREEQSPRRPPPLARSVADPPKLTWLRERRWKLERQKNYWLSSILTSDWLRIWDMAMLLWLIESFFFLNSYFISLFLALLHLSFSISQSPLLTSQLPTQPKPLTFSGAASCHCARGARPWTEAQAAEAQQAGRGRRFARQEGWCDCCRHHNAQNRCQTATEKEKKGQGK